MHRRSDEEKPDQEIIRLQGEATKARDPKRALDRLGWLFVAKARVSYDPGFYKLAEQCAACMETQGATGPDMLLLRAHALQSLHRFTEAEAAVIFADQPPHPIDTFVEAISPFSKLPARYVVFG